MTILDGQRPYKRTLDELAKKAVRHWPKELTDAASTLSALPLLLETQGQFLSVLKLANKSPDAWKQAINLSSDLPANLFLKHLMVLTNFGGEALAKVTPFSDSFVDNRMRFLWGGNECEYEFKHFVKNKNTNVKKPPKFEKTNRASNTNLRVDGKNIKNPCPLTAGMEDVIMFLLFAASSSDETLPAYVRDQCNIGDFLGQPDELERFVRQNYIRVSRQIAGQTNNTLGQLAQDAVVKALESELPDWKIKSNSNIPGVSSNDGTTDTNFDVVVISPLGKYFGIEVSFQFTGNSVIIRKSLSAKGLQDNMHTQGAYVCYVIDGTGNIISRRNAVQTICQYSDCTVAFSPDELKTLAEFMRVMEGA